MYQSSYAAMAADDYALARAQEWRALDHAVTLLEEARPTGAASPETIEAVGSQGGKTSKPVIIADCGQIA